jgi:hypothetical protein
VVQAYKEGAANAAGFFILLVFLGIADTGSVPYTALTASLMALRGTVVLRRVFLNIISCILLSMFYNMKLNTKNEKSIFLPFFGYETGRY